jgi:regulatory protein
MAPATAEDRLQHALDLAYRYLGRRDRTILEVRRHLEGKRVEPSAIDGALSELQDSGYLDDARYAQRFAEDRRELDDWGADRIARRLQAAGVGEDEVAAALGGRDAHSERDAAVALLRRKLRVAPDSDRERERALGILVRKGYALDLAYEAVRAFEREPEIVRP